MALSRRAGRITMELVLFLYRTCVCIILILILGIIFNVT